MVSREAIGKILIRCPNWVGDIVMSTPVLDCIRQNFPTAHIIGIIGKNAEGILHDGPWFDSFIPCEDKTWTGMRRMIQKIRQAAPDMAVILPNSFRSILPIWLGKVKQIYGYRKNMRGIFLTGGPEPLRKGIKVVPRPTRDYYLEICRWLDLQLPPVLSPRLFIGSALQKKAELFFGRYGINEDDTLIALNPGARFGSSKCWSSDHFAATAELFSQNKNIKIILLTGPGEDKIAQAIVSKTKIPLICPASDEADLEMLKPIIKRCNLLITNDTGPRHYAAALDVPVVVIMGPTDPRYTAVNLEKTAVIRADVHCSPCHKKICPTNHCCMKQITPQMVFEAGRRLLEGCYPYETSRLS